MSNKKIQTTMEAVNSGENHVILVGKNPLYAFEGGKRVGDQIGVRLTVAMQGNRLSQMPIRIEGDDPLPGITDEQLTEMCRERKYVYVKLKECVVTIYTVNGNMGLSGTASGVEINGNSSK